MGRRQGTRRTGRGGGGMGGGGVVPATLALDGLPAQAAAWSVNERLLTSYAGPLFRVRRSSDNTEQDITTAAASVYTDQAAIAAFCGVSNGFVTVLYDQSGGTPRDVSQATAAMQPQIYNGTVVTKNGSNVSMTYTTGTTDLTRPDSCGITGSPDFSVVALSAVPSGAFRGLFNMGNAVAAQSFYYTLNATVPNVGTYSSNDFYTAIAASGAYHYDVVQHPIGATVAACVVRQNGANSPFTSGPATPINIVSSITEVGNILVTGACQGNLSTVVLFPYVFTAPQLAFIEAWLESRRIA